MVEGVDHIIYILLVSGFFSGLEGAFLALDKLRYQVDRKEKNLFYRLLDGFYQKPEQFISTLQVGKCISLIVYTLYIYGWLDVNFGPWILNGTLLFLLKITVASAVFILFGDLIPRIIGRINPTLILLIFSIPLSIVYAILFPVSKLLSLISWTILRLVGVKNLPVSVSRSFNKMDLDTFIQQGIEDTNESAEMNTEVKIFQNALDFSNVKVRDCVVPRTEIVAADISATADELRLKFIETGLSKILIYKDNIDNVVGYIHSSEIFKKHDDWRQHIKTAPIVPETMTADKLMKRLLQDKKSIAVVVDEFGGTSGIVTLEDLVEEIFGEIEDEHDTKSYIARKVSETEYVLSGRIEIDYINETFGLDIEESDEYMTIAGYILHYYKSFPKLNETIVIGKYRFKILKVTTTKIELVNMQIEPD